VPSRDGVGAGMAESACPPSHPVSHLTARSLSQCCGASVLAGPIHAVPGLKFRPKAGGRGHDHKAIPGWSSLFGSFVLPSSHALTSPSIRLTGRAQCSALWGAPAR